MDIMKNKLLNEIIKEKRNEKNLSVNKVSKETHIPAKFIKMIEEGIRQGFPSKTHFKGFLKIYCRYLNMDLADSLIEQYVQQTFSLPGNKKQQDKHPGNEGEKIQMKEKEFYYIIGLSLLFFLLILFAVQLLP
jgi:cytoskeletal protein RodZ